MTGMPMRMAAAAFAVLAMSGQAANATTPDFFPRSSFEPIPVAELQTLDCWGLWHARNEIYARADYRFKTPAGIAEFGPDGQQDNPPLSALERSNIALVQQYEKAAGCR